MRERVERNLSAVRRRIEAAAGRAGRDPGAVQLIAVTKMVGPDAVRALYDAGQRDFGENRVAEGATQARALGEADARWHLIGHLQRNKAGRALEWTRRIHSVESEKLVEVLAKECERQGGEVDIFLEVNVSGEEAKYGVRPEGAAALARIALAFPRLRLSGLMTMAPLGEDPEAARPVFRGLREWRDRLEQELGVGLPALSMGMSGDFEVAVEEGATLVRVGTALFAD